MKKKYYLFSAVIFLSVAWAAADTISADGYTSERIDGYTWFYRIDGSTVEIGSRGLGSAAISPQPIGHLNIPSALGGKAVTSIGDWAFYNCSNLTSVTIPVGVTSIGLYAFHNCRGLTSMTIPTGNISIGQYAFYGCRGLASVTIGNGVTSIKDDAFDGCSGLTAFSVGNGNQTYKSVSGLLLTKDGKTLIHGVNGAVTIPDGVTSIGRNAFASCIGLTHVVIPNSVTSIGRNAFYNCRETLFDTATIPGVKLVDGWAVGHTSSLSGQLDLTGARGIGSYAFSSGCSGLTSVTIPDSVTSIGESAFSGCNENLFDTTTIPGVKLMDGWAVDYTSSLSGQLDLTGVRNIGRYAFSGCGGLTSVTIPDSVTSIGEYAFFSCTGLTSVAISHSVTSIRQCAFAGCYNLAAFNVDKFNAKYSSANGCLLSKDGTQLIAGVAGNVIIPDGVTSIGDQAFYNIGHYETIDISHGIVNEFGLISVTMPCTTTNIGYQAFYNCIRLREVTMPDGVTDIGNQAFYNCQGLRNVSISDSVSNIGSQAFYNCNSLTNLTIPAGVTYIGDEAFSRCRALASIIIAGDDLQIGMSAFSPCLGAECVYLPTGYVGSTSEFPSNAKIIRYKLIQTVYFDVTNGQVSPPSMEVRWMSAYGPLPVPSRDGYYFVEWTYKGNPILDDTIVSAFDDHTLVARWCPFQCSITFNANGGRGGRTLTQDYGTKLYAPTVTREGYTFMRWVPAVPTTVPASNATYTAQWQINQYTIRFNANGGTGSRMMTRDYGTSLSAPAVEREGYTFKGWSPIVPATVPAYDATYTAQWQVKQYEMTFDANGGTGVDTVTLDYGTNLSGPTVTREGYTFTGWSPEVPVSVPASNATYTAQWRINQYDMTFNANGGIGGGTVTQNYGTTLVAPTVMREGYTFTGWSPAVPATVPAYNVTHTAQWRINQCNVTFDANGGTGGCTIKQNYGTALAAPTVTRTGYTFAGWSPSVPSTMPAENTTYTAQWQVNQYIVTFNADGGTGGKTVTQDYGTTLSAPTVTRTGYTFAGWSPSVPATVPANNVTYTAQWQINQYTATFYANGGTDCTPKTQNYGTSLSAPTVTRTGYTFMGWLPAVPATMPAWNTTYTAQWQVNQYTVTFNADGGTGGWSRKQNYGSSIVAPTVTKEWCTFSGWQPVVLDTVPANDVTYTAQWQRYGDTISASKMGGKTMRELYPSDYTTMTTVILEEGITELPAGFFDGCDNVTSVTWPSTLREFGIDDLPPKIRTTVEGKYDADGFLIYNNWILGYQNRSASSVTIPEGIVGIGRGAFAEMYYLKTVTMPESLRCIAKGAFEACTSIQEFQFMSGLRYVGPEVFEDCSCLLRATFADGVEHIGANAFKDCWQMKSVRLPYTVTYIGDNAFSECSAIRGVTVPTHLKTMQALFPEAYSQIETAEVAEGETVVMDDMFAGCVALRGGATQMAQTHLSMIPNTVTNIGARAFQGCTSLTDVVVPNSVLQVGVSVFEYCSSLTNMTLSINLSAIPDRAFKGCSKLDSMKVPANVCYLGKEFFCGKYLGDNALYYLCTNAPSCHSDAYAAITGDMTTYVLQESRGWDGRSGSPAPPKDYMWNGYRWTYWTPLRFDVTFDANGGRFDSSGGSTWSEQQITDTPYALPSTEPVRPGWAFEGWWTEQTGGAEVRYTTKVTATRSFTLYAHWRSLGNTMTVTFNSNGGTVVTPGTQDYVPGQTFGQFPSTTRRGYTFQGWWTEAVGGTHMTEAMQVPAADMELFAHWSPIKYLVRFNANGGMGAMLEEEFTYDVSQPLNTHTFTRTGFAFTGWATTPSGQVRYPENKTVVNLEEVHGKIVDLYAVWSVVGYSVRFDNNGGTGVMDNQTIAVGETQNLWPCVFARAGYAFAGWAVSPTDAEAKNVAYRDGQAVRNLAMSNGTTVPLYAVWVAKSNTVRITFDANGGSVAPEFWDCVVGSAVEAFPTTPTRPGFTFAGWWTARTGGTQVSSIARVTSAQTFYARWAENGGVDPGDNTYIVRFHKYDGSGATADQVLNVGETKNLLWKDSQLGWSRSGYTFVGWVPWDPDGKNCILCKYANGEKVKDLGKAGEVVHLYAGWKSSYRYQMCFNRNDGTGATMTQVMLRDKDVGLAWKDSQIGWTRSGYSFKGWAESASGSVKYANGAMVRNIAAAGATKQLYAVWTADQSTYTVRFNKNDGSGATKDQTFKVGETKSLLWKDSELKWTRDGYTFKGWAESATGSVKYSNGQSVKDIAATGATKNLYAIWQSSSSQAIYTVRFHKYDGSGATADQVFNVGETKNLLWKDSQLGWSRSGYTFVGWVPWDPDGKNCILCKYVNGEKVKDLGKAGEVVHLYAGWRSSYRYQVCFNKNDGTGATMIQVMLRDKDVGLAWKDSQIGWTRAGYTFKGWAETASGAVKYANGATVRNLAAAGATKQLYAVWLKADAVSAAPRIMAYSVAAPKPAVPEWAVGTFYGEDGDSLATVTVSAGGEVSGIVLFENDTWTIEGTVSGLCIDAEVVDGAGSSRPTVLWLSLTDDGRVVIESEDGLIGSSWLGWR